MPSTVPRSAWVRDQWGCSDSFLCGSAKESWFCPLLTESDLEMTSDPVLVLLAACRRTVSCASSWFLRYPTAHRNEICRFQDRWLAFQRSRCHSLPNTSEPESRYRSPFSNRRRIYSVRFASYRLDGSWKPHMLSLIDKERVSIHTQMCVA